ncbi:MAG TPA: DGQHR domain-containing protein [Candidatus Bathyarchaeia archaeon]|nr:DGQHR domain-containing protein [Candidatus Bathyarchaeia archaeon]
MSNLRGALPSDEADSGTIEANGFLLQENPSIFVAALPGRWLLRHSTPSWRIEDPEKGFQRVVREERAREIAAAVLDQHRTFPNAIILATELRSLKENEARIEVPNTARFLVVDGQHRLWAQKYSNFEAMYCCMIHLGLSEPDMAQLFLEINETQRRVPSSLRWDLVRLIRPEERQDELRAAELTNELAVTKGSPLYQRIDLTGEQPQISLKQGSVAPEIRTIIASRTSPLYDLDFDSQFDILMRYFAAIKSRDPDRWKTADSVLYQARIIRALVRLLPEIIRKVDAEAREISARTYKTFMDRIKLQTLDPDTIRDKQGSAGVSAIYRFIKEQVLPS